MSGNYLNNKLYPLGVRNHNPGNIVKSSAQWPGKIVPSAHPRFEQFETMDDGIFACVQLLCNYVAKKGKNTIRKIISTYAPPNENNTAAYIAAVSKASGMGPDQPITQITGQLLQAMARQIFKVENGVYHSVISDEQIKAAIARLPQSISGVPIKNSFFL